MLKKISLFVGVALAISACGGNESSTSVKSMQKKDKKLSCEEILLEMNEADFYKQMANKNKGPKLKNVLMPLGYISTYMNAEEAVGAADARVAYLDKIYEIMRCEQKIEKEEEREDHGSIPYFGPRSSIDSSAGQQYGESGMVYYRPY